MTADEHAALDALLHEHRAFPPTSAFAPTRSRRAALYDDAQGPRRVVGRARRGRSSGPSPGTPTLEWELPFAKWFVGGTLNASVNCLDRHVAAGNGDRVALHWVGEPEGDRLDLTYAELLARVCQAAHALESLGVTRATASRSTCR